MAVVQLLVEYLPAAELAGGEVAVAIEEDGRFRIASLLSSPPAPSASVLTGDTTSSTEPAGQGDHPLASGSSCTSTPFSGDGSQPALTSSLDAGAASRDLSSSTVSAARTVRKVEATAGVAPALSCVRVHLPRPAERGPSSFRDFVGFALCRVALELQAQESGFINLPCWLEPRELRERRGITVSAPRVVSVSLHPSDRPTHVQELRVFLRGMPASIPASVGARGSRIGVRITERRRAVLAEGHSRDLQLPVRCV
eukprot:tig00000248_g21813.t1